MDYTETQLRVCIFYLNRQSWSNRILSVARLAFFLIGIFFQLSDFIGNFIVKQIFS